VGDHVGEENVTVASESPASTMDAVSWLGHLEQWGSIRLDIGTMDDKGCRPHVIEGAYYGCRGPRRIASKPVD
jgi:hypothetical protein